MRLALGIALLVGLAFGTASCGSSKDGKESKDPAGPEMAIKDVRVVWTRGGRLGYIRTFDMTEAGGPTLRIHYVEDTDFHQVGWYADDGQGERFDYPATRVGEARRTVFDRIELPPDAAENQIRRILQVEPTTEIRVVRAEEIDLRR